MPIQRCHQSKRARPLLVAIFTAAVMLAAIPAAAADATVVDCETRSLQAAVDAAEPGAVLDIVNGPCYGNVYVDKDVTIRGNRPVVRDTEVDGTVTVGAAANVILEDLGLGADHGTRAVVAAGAVTLRNSEIYGGGLAVDGGDATLVDTVVQESVYEFVQGGGIYSCGTLSITGGWIGDNFAEEGGGIYVACGEAGIVGTSLSGNGAYRGGAVYVAAEGDASLTIVDSDLRGNAGYETGGAIHVAGGTATVAGTTIADNTAQDGGGLYNVAGDVSLSGALILSNEAAAQPIRPSKLYFETWTPPDDPGPHLLEDARIETTTGPCVEIVDESEVTLRNVEIGPCGTDEPGGNEGIVIERSSVVGIYDSFIHPESAGDSGIAIRAVHSSDIEVAGNVIANGSSNLFAAAVSRLSVADNLLLNPLGPYGDNKQIQVWGRAPLDDPNATVLVDSSDITIENNVLVNSVDPYWGLPPDPGDAINLGYTIDATVRGNHIIGGHGFQACGIITDHATVSGALIVDNVLVGTGSCGIGVAGGEEIDVSGNAILNGHVNMPDPPGGNVAMYAHNFYSDEPPTGSHLRVCRNITIENNVATSVYRDGSFRDFHHPKPDSGQICTDAAGHPLTLDAIAESRRNILGEEALAELDPLYRTRPVPSMPPQPNGKLVVSPYVAGPGRANGNGGAVYNVAGQVDMVDTNVLDNTAGNSGGGIYNGWRGSVEADSSKIDGNAAAAGGGVANWGGAVTLRRSRIGADPAASRGVTGNLATRSGGALHNWYGVVAISGVDFVGNTAETGGAISNDSGGTVKVERSTLIANEAAATGGAIFTAGGQTIVGNSIVDDNSATRGGGIHALLGTIEIHDTSVSANASIQRGGGIALGSINQSDALGNLEVGSTASIRDAEIDGNLGGGIHASAGTHLDLERVRVTSNVGNGIVAENPGAIVPLVEVEIRESNVANNTLHGVEVHGDLVVDGSTLSGNQLSGFVVKGSAAISATTVANNRSGGWVGCGRSSSGTSLVLDQVEVRANEPNGGLYVACGDASIVDSSFVHNYDSLEGGGALYAEAARVEVVDTTFRENRADGPLGPVNGGAILNQGEMRLDGVTVYANVASGLGGGIHSSGVLEITNSTLSANESGRRGGGLDASSTGSYPKWLDPSPRTSLRHVTITNNTAAETAGGLSATGGKILSVFGSIVAGNTSNGQPDVDVSGSVSMTSAYNLFGDCCDFTWSATDLIDVADARLGPLGDNGGPTETHTLLPDSPAIDLIPAAACRNEFDQRSVARPQGGACDAGAIELKAAIDIGPPSVEVGFPYGATFTETPVTLSGTASDDTGVEMVRVAIRDRASGLWLQDDMISFGPFNRFPSVLSEPGATATDWSFTVALADGDYLLSVRATDLAGKETSVSPWHYFVVRTADTAPPVVDAGYAQDTVFRTDPVVLTGSASDDVGVARVRVAIRHRATGHWLQEDMTTFAPSFHRFSAVLSDPGAAATGWSFEVGLPEGGYTTSVRATDLAGNEQSISPWRRFSVDIVDPADTAPPVVDAGYAQDTVFRTDPVVLTGSASDDVGVARVRVAIRHRATGHWLQEDMTTFAPSFHRFSAVLSDPGAAATGWSFEVGLPEGGYTTSVRATDLAGNEQSISPWRRFSVRDLTHRLVRSHQKISSTQGGFGSGLDDHDDFGRSVADIGDLNGDGVTDLAIGASSDDDNGFNKGAINILFMNSDGTVASKTKISETTGGHGTGGGNFGTGIANMGDLDGDGLTDLAVGNQRDDTGGFDKGAVWIISLKSDGTVDSEVKIAQGIGGFGGTLPTSANFGFSVTNIGDLNDDGVTDLAVGAPGEGGTTGEVWVLVMKSDGSVDSEQQIKSGVGGFTGTLDVDDFFGVTVAGLGDLDGDGIEDVAVGATGDDDGGSNRGAAWILFLDTDGTVKSHAKISDTAGGFTGSLDDGDGFGAATLWLGDFNGDGVSDLGVGARDDDDGGNGTGALWFLYLSSGGTVRSHGRITDIAGGFTGVLDDLDWFGWAGSTIGDLNGDGATDLAVSALRDDDGGTDRGAVWILFMS